MIQAQSDVFLGWTEGDEDRHFYVRQLHDWKGSVSIEQATPSELQRYAGLCAWTLARGHARSGDAVAIRAYAGKSDSLDRAVGEFAEAYAAQNVADHERFHEAIRQGRIVAAEAP